MNNTESTRLAFPISDIDRARRHTQISKLHKGNRFRLMFQLPILPSDIECLQCSKLGYWKCFCEPNPCNESSNARSV